jgi:hypothetical protein
MYSRLLTIKEVDYEGWQNVEAFRATSALGIITDVPAGFRCDLASVPKIVRSVISQLGYWTQPAVTHDLQHWEHRQGVNTTLTRHQSNRMMLEGMIWKAEQFNVPRGEWRHDAIYAAIEAFGLPSWETPAERRTRLDMHGDTEFLDQ